MKCYLFFSLFLLPFQLLAQNNSNVILDDFEKEFITVINEKESNPNSRLLWSQYENYPKKGSQKGYEEIVTGIAHSGINSLKITVEAGHIYLQFYPKPSSNTWDFLHQHIQHGDWAFNKYDRLKFWVLLPPGIKKANGGRKNTTFGTYYRKSNGKLSSAESGGNHPYHYYDIESTGEWHQIIVDTHPNHIRGVTGGREHKNMPNPTKERGINYFDSLTRFYFDMEGSVPYKPANFYFDDFEFYQAPPNENIEQVYSLNGVYVKKSNKIIIGWMRNKNENKIKHEVRYSFEDIFSKGWDSAKLAPNGLVKPSGWGGYNGMSYKTNKIDTKGKSVIYLAIKPINSNLFRQIEIPLK